MITNGEVKAIRDHLIENCEEYVLVETCANESAGRFEVRFPHNVVTKKQLEGILALVSGRALWYLISYPNLRGEPEKISLILH